MDAAVAALLGSVIGLVGGIGGTWIQTSHQTKREVTKMAVALAEADYERMRKNPKPGEFLPPIAVYVAYHAELLRTIADNSFGPHTIRELDGKQRALFEALIESDKTVRQPSAAKPG